MTMPDEPPTEPFEHLLKYGYAPGWYCMTCKGCGKYQEFVDKRAVLCRECAEKKYAENNQ